jgi:hypothetical protein
MYIMEKPNRFVMYRKTKLVAVSIPDDEVDTIRVSLFQAQKMLDESGTTQEGTVSSSDLIAGNKPFSRHMTKAFMHSFKVKQGVFVANARANILSDQPGAPALTECHLFPCPQRHHHTQNDNHHSA